MESADDQYHAGFYLKDLPESLENGECRNKAKDLHELFIYNHYEIDPSLVVDYIDKYFDNLKDNVYTYLLIINLIIRLNGNYQIIWFTVSISIFLNSEIYNGF